MQIRITSIIHIISTYHFAIQINDDLLNNTVFGLREAGAEEQTKNFAKEALAYHALESNHRGHLRKDGTAYSLPKSVRIANKALTALPKIPKI